MTDARALRQLLANASPLPWIETAAGNVRSAAGLVVSSAAVPPRVCDSDLIAAAVNSLPELLDEYATLTRQRDEAVRLLKIAHHISGVGEWERHRDALFAEVDETKGTP